MKLYNWGNSVKPRKLLAFQWECLLFCLTGGQGLQLPQCHAAWAGFSRSGSSFSTLPPEWKETETETAHTEMSLIVTYRRVLSVPAAVVTGYPIAACPVSSAPPPAWGCSDAFLECNHRLSTRYRLYSETIHHKKSGSFLHPQHVQQHMHRLQLYTLNCAQFRNTKKFNDMFRQSLF